MFLYYIPPPNKWQPHKAVKDSLGTPDNKIQIFCEKCSWLEIYRNFGTCSVVSLVFFCPDHYGRRPKSRVLISEKIWGSMKYFSMSNILDIEKYIYVLILLYLAKGSKSLKPVTINSICVTSVKCCVCCERSKPSSHLPPSVSKHPAVALKRQP